jgi:hypothetical protein
VCGGAVDAAFAAAATLPARGLAPLSSRAPVFRAPVCPRTRARAARPAGGVRRKKRGGVGGGRRAAPRPARGGSASTAAASARAFARPRRAHVPAMPRARRRPPRAAAPAPPDPATGTGALCLCLAAADGASRDRGRRAARRAGLRRPCAWERGGRTAGPGRRPSVDGCARRARLAGRTRGWRRPAQPHCPRTRPAAHQPSPLPSPGKNDNDEKRELIFKEDGQGWRGGEGWWGGKARKDARQPSPSRSPPPAPPRVRTGPAHAGQRPPRGHMQEKGRGRGVRAAGSQHHPPHPLLPPPQP